MVFKKYKSKTKGSVKGRMFFHTNYKTNKKTFEALFFELLGYTFWLWRNEKIANDWPNAA